MRPEIPFIHKCHASYIERRGKVGKYGDWTITVSVSGETALAEKRLNGDVLSLSLARSNNSSYDCFEGWWPHRPKNIRRGIGGLCLWCHRWTIYFEPVNGKSPAARRYPASEIDRKEVVERIKKGGRGSRITHMDVPVKPRNYHLRTIDRQARAAKDLGIKEMFYHVPVAEYHQYIAEIEEALGQQLFELHAHLDRFVDEVRELVLSKFNGVRVVFIDPTPLANGDPNGSFVLPYRHPELFGIDLDGLVGIENLVEVRLAYEAHHQGGPLIPVYGIAVGMPYPYREKSSDMNGVAVLGLSP